MKLRGGGREQMQKDVTQREKLWDAGEVVKVSGRVFGTVLVECLELAHYATKG